jgi:hypothetical protein
MVDLLQTAGSGTSTRIYPLHRCSKPRPRRRRETRCATPFIRMSIASHLQPHLHRASHATCFCFRNPTDELQRLPESSQNAQEWGVAVRCFTGSWLAGDEQLELAATHHSAGETHARHPPGGANSRSLCRCSFRRDTAERRAGCRQYQRMEVAVAVVVGNSATVQLRKQCERVR